MNDRWLGFYLISYGLVAVSSYWYYNALEYVFWFCNHTSFVLGFGFLLRKKYLVSGEAVLGLVPQFVWVLSFGLGLSGAATLEATAYMFDSSYPWPLYIVSLNHFVLLGILFYSFLKFSVTKLSFSFSIIHGLILVFFSFVSPEKNINCIQASCLPFSLPYYQVLFPLVYILLVMAPLALFNTKRISQ
jgi:hypothetical protein